MASGCRLFMTCFGRLSSRTLLLRCAWLLQEGGRTLSKLWRFNPVLV